MFAIMRLLGILRVVIPAMVILLFLCNEAIGTEVQEVKLYKPENWSQTYLSGKQFTVLENKPLFIVFEESYATNVICMRADMNENIFVVKCDGQNKQLDIYKNGTSVCKVPNVTVSMNCKWSCQGAYYVKSKMTNILFGIRVKGAKKVRVYIDGFERLFTTSALSQPDYDGVYEHPYEDGDTIDLACNNFDWQGETRLRYYDAHGNQVLETDVMKETLSFRQSMRRENNRSYVDCTYLIKEEETQYGDFQEYTYRIIFMAKNETRNNGFIVTINDTKLAPNQMYSEDGIYKYQYKFIYGETLMVTCEKKNKEIPGEIHIEMTHEHDLNNNNYLRDVEHKSWRRSVLIDTKNLHHLQCFSREEQITVDIEFQADVSHKTFIQGLPASGILYQYSKNANEWVTHYQYTVNETLYLACMTTENRTLQWNFRTVVKPKVVIRGDIGTRNIYGIFDFNHTHNETNIKCEATKNWSPTQKYTITLHQKLDISSMNTSQGNRGFILANLSDEGSLILIVGGVLCCVLVVIVTTVLAYCWCTRVRNTGTIERPFENFNENNNPIPTFPSQWNDNEYTYIQNEYTYIKNDDSVMLENYLYCGNKRGYAVPQKRITACSNQTENHYTEIDDIINRNDGKKSEHLQQPASHKQGVIKNETSISNTTYSNIRGGNYIKNLQKDNINAGYDNVFIGDSISTREVRNKSNSNLQGELYSNSHCLGGPK